MKATIRWLLGIPHDYDDVHVLRRAVWVMLMLTFMVFVGLVVSVDYVVRADSKLRFQFAYERHLCLNIANGRVGLNTALVEMRKRPLPPIDCRTATEASTLP